MSDSQVSTLPALGFAKELSEEQRRILSEFGDFTTFDPGQEIIKEGDPHDTLHLVVSGSVHVSTSAMGRTIFLTNLRAGDSIGEINILDPAAASATVEAHEFAVLWSISRDKLMSFIHSNPEASAKFLLSIATTLSKRLRKTNQKVAVAQEVMSNI